jgi:hypothetical protein
MNNKGQIGQNNSQEKYNNIKNYKKEEETNYQSNKENYEKPIDKKTAKKEREKISHLGEIKSNEDKQKIEQIIPKKEVIIQFLAQMGNKCIKDDNNSKKTRTKEEESDDPFLKAENEYRNKNWQKQNKNFLEEEKKAKSEKKYLPNKKNLGFDKYKLKDKKLTANIIYKHFKKSLSSRKTGVKYKFKPTLFKNPENLYLQAIQESNMSLVKMKLYKRKTGILDFKLFNKKKNLYLNQNQNFYNTKSSFYNKNTNYNSFLSENGIQSYLDYIKYNKKIETIKNNYNKLNRRKFYLNNELVNKVNINNNQEISSNKDNNLFYNSVSGNSQLTDKNYILNNKNKIENKEYILNNHLQEEINETKSENLIKEGKNLKKVNKNKENFKAYSANTNRILVPKYLKHKKLLSTKTKKNKNSIYLTNKLLYSINDPQNPYSIYFTKNLLKNMFKMDIKYNKFELGVPLLSMKHSSKRKRLKFSEKPKERMAKTTYSNFPNNNQNKQNKRYHTGNNFYKKL